LAAGEAAFVVEMTGIASRYRHADARKQENRRMPSREFTLGGDRTFAAALIRDGQEDAAILKHLFGPIS
jgi:hypothetical protein